MTMTFEQIEALELNLWEADGVGSRKALIAAYNALPDGPERVVVAAMLQQRGCEEWGVSSGRLTQLIDVAIFG